MKKLLSITTLVLFLLSCQKEEIETDSKKINGCFSVIDVKTSKRINLGCVTKYEWLSGTRLLPEAWYDGSRYKDRQFKQVKNCSECQ